jgi:hypothetical protein
MGTGGILEQRFVMGHAALLIHVSFFLLMPFNIGLAYTRFAVVEVPNFTFLFIAIQPKIMLFHQFHLSTLLGHYRLNKSDLLIKDCEIALPLTVLYRTDLGYELLQLVG